MKNPIRNAVVEISKHDLVTCKRCGCPDLAWVTYKSGKHGLVETACSRPLWRGQGPAPVGLFALKFNYHNCAEYTAQMEEIKRRSSQCHPKADKPREIISDAISYLVLQYAHENGGPSGWSKVPITAPIMQAIEILSAAASKIQEVKS